MVKFNRIENDIDEKKSYKIEHIKTYIEGLIKRSSALEVYPSVIEGTLQVF